MKRYHPALVALHWLLALMLFVALIVGTVALDPIPESDPAKIDALRSHMIAGLAIGVLMLIRLAIRLRSTHPPEADIGNALLNRAAKWAHWGLYLLVFGMVGSGIAMSAMAGLPPIVFGGSGDPLPASFNDLPPRAAHGLFATLLMLLILGHIAAAFYHEFVRHDGLIGRMWFGKRLP
ncbi:MAG: cytochrome b/b6 domain-containing protein [Pseudomonadota bacterium]